MPYKNPPPCQICGKPSVSKKMCDKHYRRWKKHGNPHGTKRPDDWGQRHKHSLWHTWKWTARAKAGRVKRWDDFWTFVADVGERPDKNSRLKRQQIAAPFGPNNFFWSEPLGGDWKELDAREKRAAYMKEWRKRHPAKAKEHVLKKQYGIGLDEYHDLLHRQDGVCAICGKGDDHFSLAVDHCHSTKRVRGLLCSKCNRGVGLFEDEPERLERAAAYLRHPTRLL